MRTRIIVLLLVGVTLAGGDSVIAAPPPPVYPWPIGPGPRYQPPAVNQAVLDGKPAGGMRCANGKRFAVHIELFAHRKVIVVPPGIGVARSGCSYPLRTKAPTGVVDVLTTRRSTLGDLFTIWGRRSAADRAEKARANRARGGRLRRAASELPVPERRRMRLPVLAAMSLVLLAGCGGPSKSGFPTVAPVRTFQMIDFKPTAPVKTGRLATVSFVIRQPDGKPLTSFRRGSGPHTGVHLIFVRRDLSVIVHRHPPIASDGTISDTIPFEEPGPYRLVVDVYPNTTGPQ